MSKYYAINNVNRDGDKRVVTVKEGGEFVKDAHVFIVDDLVKTGMKERKTKLKYCRRNTQRDKRQAL